MYPRQIAIKDLGASRFCSYKTHSGRSARAAKGAIVYDIVSVLFVLVFFALCVAYTHACDRILGPGEQVEATAPAGDGPGRADEAVVA